MAASTEGKEGGRACDERKGEESEHVSILTHQSEQRIETARQRLEEQEEGRIRRKSKPNRAGSPPSCSRSDHGDDSETQEKLLRRMAEMKR